MVKLQTIEEAVPFGNGTPSLLRFARSFLKCKHPGGEWGQHSPCPPFGGDMDSRGHRRNQSE